MVGLSVFFNRPWYLSKIVVKQKTWCSYCEIHWAIFLLRSVYPIRVNTGSIAAATVSLKPEQYVLLVVWKKRS